MPGSQWMRIQYAQTYIVFVELVRRRVAAYDPAEHATLPVPVRTPIAPGRRAAGSARRRRDRPRRQPLEFLRQRRQAVGPKVGAEHGEAPRRRHFGRANCGEKRAPPRAE
uniref:Uncharacterized protein n=1 Tax=Arundo donax TaxID=35708 RepID=A0A0A9HCT2_ARUDO